MAGVGRAGGKLGRRSFEPFGGAGTGLVSWDQVYAYTGGMARQRQQWVPHWFVVVVTAVLPSARAAGRLGATVRRRMARRRLSRIGLCPSCGYDLTANVSGVCPECGKATAAT